MAKSSSPIGIQGAVGSLVFARTQSGGTRVYARRAKPSRRKWLATTAKTLCGVSAQEFGGAAMAGSAMYRDICHGKAERAHFAPYAHNKLARALRSSAPREVGPCARYTGAAAVQALRHIDLSHEGSPSSAIRMQALGPIHQPSHIRIAGIREAASQFSASTHGLEIQVSIRSAHFQEVEFDKKPFRWKKSDHRPPAAHSTTLWIPVDIIPSEGLNIPIPPQPPQHAEAHLLHFVVIKWRRLRQRQKPQPLPRLTIARCAAASIPAAEAAATPIRVKHARYKRHTPSKAAGHRHIKQALPSLYLRMALAAQPPGIRPPV